MNKTEKAKHLILSALEDGLELVKNNGTGLSKKELAEDVAGFCKQANMIAKRYGFETYFKP